MTNTLATYASMTSELSFGGNSSYRIDGDRVHIELDVVLNSRLQNDISGTLSVELWALHQPYAGQDFSGIALAGTAIGEVNGGHYLENCAYDLCFQAPPPGKWHLTLMLREWTGTGYVTRDYVNFPVPYSVQWQPVVIENPQPVSVVTTTEAPVIAEPTVAAVPPAPVAVIAGDVVETVAVTSVVKSTKSTTSTSKAKKGRAASSKAAPSVTPPTLPHLNKATQAELVSIKGVSESMAKALIASRPFKGWITSRKSKALAANCWQNYALT